jgi:hypothetical protein
LDRSSDLATKIIIAVLVVVIAALVLKLVMDNRKGNGSTDISLPPPETLDARDVAAFIETEATTFRIRTTQDVLPGGYSAAMTPLLVDWEKSDVSPGGEILLLNINHGGNPVSGVTELRSAVIRPDKIIKAQFIMVPLGGPEAISHGQVRFIFEEGGAEFSGGDRGVAGKQEVLEDLIVSWEAWRAPGVDYKMMKGMDPETYELSCRAYSGPQRFLEDALMNRDWNMYELDLPGGRESYRELLLVALALGDGASRHSIVWMIEEAERKWRDEGLGSDPEQSAAVGVWKALKERAGSSSPPVDDPRADMTGKTGYQSLIRSCATMALYIVDLTVARLIEAGYPHEGKRPTKRPEMIDEPEWMVELGSADIAGILMRTPKALAYARSTPTIIPGNIPKALEDAGLLVMENGKPWYKRYSMQGDTPWGHRWQLLIR